MHWQHPVTLGGRCGTMNFKRLKFVESGSLAQVVIDSGGENLVDRRLLTELEEVARRIADSEEFGVVLLEAQGKDFCSGWEASVRDELRQRDTPAEPAVIDPFGSIASLACPVVVALQGKVRSAGLELALACDIRLAADNARFSLPEVAEGDFPLAGGTQRLPRAVGRGAALSMLLLGDELDAESALRSGLVSRILPAADLAAGALSLAERISSRGPIALRYAKEAALHGAEMSLDQGLRLETDLSIILQTTDDRDEGVRAFLEKRRPRFKGR